MTKKPRAATKKKVAETQSVNPEKTVDPDTIQSPVRELLKSHGLSLDSIFKHSDVQDYVSQIRSPPPHRIPRVQSVSDSALVYQESEDWEQGEEEQAEELGRGER